MCGVETEQRCYESHPPNQLVTQLLRVQITVQTQSLEVSPMSIRLYVGNLPEDVNRQDLETGFTEGGIEAAIKLITDRKTNKCRGFGFVTVNTDEEADQFIEKFNGQTIADIVLKIEKALPRAKSDEESAAGTSTPAPDRERIPGPGPSLGNKSKSGGGGGNSGGGKGKGGGNRSNNNNSNNSGGGTARVAQVDLESIQPDPRWAALEKLKEQLAAQTTSS
jgi:RNA recognition motif-containing protein